MALNNLAVSILINARDQASDVLDKVKGKFLAFAAVLGGGALFGAAVESSAEFEKAMDGVASKLGGTEEQMKKLTDAALAIGASGQASAIDAAKGLETLVASGLSAEDSIVAIVPALQAAKAEGIELDAAAGMITSTMGQMGLGVENAARILDVFTKAGQLSNTNATEMAEAFKQTGAMAKAVGLSLEETSAALDVLANAGIRGGEAGTALRNMLGMLSDPASKARAELAKLGDTSGSLTAALDTISAAGARGDAAIQAFGVEVGPALRSMVAAGSESLNKFKVALEDAGGTVETTSKVMSDNFLGAFNKLGAVFESVKIKLMQPLLAPLTQEINAFVSWMQSVAASKALTDFGTAIASGIKIAITAVREFIQTADWNAIGASIGSFAASAKDNLTSFANNMAMVSDAISVVVNSISGAVKALALPFAVLGGVVLDAVAKVTAAGAAMGAVTQETADKAKLAADTFREHFTSMAQSAGDNFTSAGKAAVDFATRMGDSGTATSAAAQQVTTAAGEIASATDSLFDQQKSDAAKQLSSAAAAYAQSLTDTVTPAGDLAAKQEVLKLNLDAAKAAFEAANQKAADYQAAQTALTTALAQQDAAYQAYKTALDAAKNGNADAALSIESLHAKLTDANSTVTAAATTLGQFTTANTATTSAIKETGTQADQSKVSIAALKEEYQRLLKAGEGEAAASLLTQIQTLEKGVVEAFKRMGVESTAAVDELVAKSAQDFQAISDASGKMSIDAKNAFLSFAQTKVDSAALYSDAQQREIDADLRRQAALLGLSAEYDAIASKIENSTLAMERESEALKRSADLTAAKHDLKKQEIEQLIALETANKNAATAAGDLAGAASASNKIASLSIDLAKQNAVAAQDAATAASANAQALAAKATAAQATANADGVVTAAEQAMTTEMSAAAQMAQVQAQSLQSKADAAQKAAKASAQHAAAASQEATAVKSASQETDWQSVNHDKNAQAADKNTTATEKSTQATIRYGNQIGITKKELGDLSEYYDVAAKASNAAVEKIAEGWKKGKILSLPMMLDMIKTMNRFGDEAGLAAANHAKAVDLLNAKMTELKARYDAGDLSLQEYVLNLKSAATATGSLNDQDLADLRSEIAAAKEEMQSFTESAQDGLSALRQEWAELNGDKVSALQIQQQQQRLELAEKISAAEQQGNSAALDVLKQQQTLLTQIQSKKMQDLRDEMQAQTTKNDTVTAQSRQASSLENANHKQTMSHIDAETKAIENMQTVASRNQTPITNIEVIKTVVHQIDLDTTSLFGSEQAVNSFLSKLSKAGLTVR